MTPEGYLQVDAVIGRTGIQTYLGDEIPGFDLDPTKQYRIYRSPDEVFKPATLQSFENKPVTNEHPYDAGGILDASTTKNRLVGCVHSGVSRDADTMRATMTIYDQNAIDAVNDGKTGLSCGYRLKIDMTPGVTPDGEKYDGYQKNIIGNHVAICAIDAARGGRECRILDSKKMRSSKMSDANTMQLPDLSDINQLGQLMQRVIGMLSQIQGHLTEKDGESKSLSEDDEKSAMTTASSNDDDGDEDPNTMSTDMSKENERLKGEIAAMKSQLNDAMKLRDEVPQIVSQRTQLIDSAKQILQNVDLHSMTDIEIKKAVIKKYDESLALDSKSIDFIDGFYNCAISNLCNGVGAAARLGAAIASAKPFANDSNDQRSKLLAEMDQTDQAMKNLNKRGDV